MLHLLSRFRRPAETKASRAGAAVALYVAGRPVWTPRDYAALAREGFQRNAVVHRAVGSSPRPRPRCRWSLIEGGRIVDAHPLLALLRRPEPARGRAAFPRERLRASDGLRQRLCRGGRASTARRANSTRCGPTGCASCRARTAGRRPTITPSARETVRFDAGAGEAVPPILHLTLFHPTDDHYGLSPMEAAAVRARHPQRGRRLEQGAPRQRRAALRAPSSSRRGWRRADRGAVRAAEGASSRRTTRARAMPAGRCCSKAGSTGSRCRCRRRTWISSRRRPPRRARSRSPSACRRCCSALPATTPTPTTPRRTAPSTARR